MHTTPYIATFINDLYLLHIRAHTTPYMVASINDPPSSVLCSCQRLYCSALLMVIIFLYSSIEPFEFSTISLHKVCPLLIMICRVDTEQSNEIIYISCLTRCPQSRQSLSVDSAAVQDQARCRLDPCIPRKYTLHTGRVYTAYRAHF